MFADAFAGPIADLMNNVYASQAPVNIQHNFENDTLEIRKGDQLASIPRHLASNAAYQQALFGCSENDINKVLINQHAALGNYMYGAQNAYGFKKKFPRNEQEMDTIMLRRVNARLQLKQEKITRHWKHVAIGTVVVIFAPLVIAAVLRMWGFAMAWIAA